MLQISVAFVYAIVCALLEHLCYIIVSIAALCKNASIYVSQLMEEEMLEAVECCFSCSCIDVARLR